MTTCFLHPVSLLTLTCLLAPAPGGATLGAADEKIEVLRVEQITSGLPSRDDSGEKDGPAKRGGNGDAKKSVTRQVLWLDPNKSRIRLEQYASRSETKPDRVYVVQPAPKGEGSLSWEFPGGGTDYHERRGDFNDLQKKRRIHEEEMLRIIRGYPAAERKKALEKLGLRLDGKRVVDIGWSPAEPGLGRPCKRLVVTENDRPIIDADIAAVPVPGAPGGAGGGASYFGMYRRLGVFSEEVLSKLEKIDGLPLRADITVVTDLSPYTLTVEVQKLEIEKVDAKFFDLPEGAKKIPEIPPVSTCPVCRKRFETKTGNRFFLPDGGMVYICGPECYREIRRTRTPPRRREKN